MTEQDQPIKYAEEGTFNYSASTMRPRVAHDERSATPPKPRVALPKPMVQPPATAAPSSTNSTGSRSGVN